MSVEGTNTPSAPEPQATSDQAAPVSLRDGSFTRRVTDQQGHEVDDPTLPSTTEIRPPQKAPEQERKTPKSTQWANLAKQQRQLAQERERLNALRQAHLNRVDPRQRAIFEGGAAIDEYQAQAHRYLDEHRDELPFITSEPVHEVLDAMVRVQAEVIQRTGRPASTEEVAQYLETLADYYNRRNGRKVKPAPAPPRSFAKNPLNLTADERYERALRSLRSNKR